MAKPFEAVKAAYGGEIPDPPGRWQLGPLVPGSHTFDTMPCQLIDGPDHIAKIEVHGDWCDSIAQRIVDALNGQDPPRRTHTHD